MSLTNDNNADFSNVSQCNYDRVYNTVSKVGYSDGITDGRDSVFQKGFDSGYENGLLTGFEFAKYKAFFAVINKENTIDDIRTESKIYEDLQIPDAKDKSHFKILQLPEKGIIDVCNEQVNYMSQHKSVLARDLPIVTNLFSQ